jgi:hypothetical protein
MNGRPRTRRLHAGLAELKELAAGEPRVPPPLAERVRGAVERLLEERGLPPRGPGSRLPRTSGPPG